MNESTQKTAAPDESKPSTMLAMVIDETGGPEVFRAVRDHQVPTPINDELLIRVHAAGINPIDAKTRAGKGVAAAIARYPCILGNDFSGIVVATPYEDHPLQPGDEVYGMARVPRGAGTYAQLVAVQSMSVSRKPASISLTEAGAVPLAAMTAWGAVMDVAHARQGQRILIHAGSGGVGHFAVQFAAQAGAHVITTGSARNNDFLRGLGAEQIVDYTAERFEDVVEPVDIVIDLIGNVNFDTGTRSLKVLKPGGLIVNVPSGSWPTLMADATAADMRATTYKVAPDSRKLDAITQLIDDGVVKVHIDRTFPLTAVAEAHRTLEQGHTRGKIVLDVANVA